MIDVQYVKYGALSGLLLLCTGTSSTQQEAAEKDDNNVESEQMNPLVDEIMNKVNEALSASGITNPGF